MRLVERVSLAVDGVRGRVSIVTDGAVDIYERWAERHPPTATWNESDHSAATWSERAASSVTWTER